MAYKNNQILELAVFMANATNGVTLDDIQKKFNVSRRTAERKRDEVLQNFEWSYGTVLNDRKKRWKVTDTKLINQLLQSFNIEDIATLQLLKQEIKSNNKDQFTEFIDELVNKIKISQEKTNSIDYAIENILDAEGWVVRQRPHYEFNKKLLSLIRNSLQSQTKIKFDYNKKGEVSSRVVHPYGILHGRDKMYLIGYSESAKLQEENDNGIRTFALTNISNLEVTDIYYDPIEEFDFKEYVNRSFGIYHDEMMDIRLKFTGSAADSAKEYFFHPSQKITEEGGDLIVEFAACGKMEICWELFKWGTSVQILGPKDLNDYYKNILNNILKNMN